MDAPFERSSPLRLPVFTMEDFENAEDHSRGVLPYMGYIGTCRRIRYGFRGSRSLNGVSFLTLSILCSYPFWRFVDTRLIVRPRFCTHFADILNSQLMYTVQLLMIKGGLTLILSFPKAWFLSWIRRSNFCCFLHRTF